MQGFYGFHFIPSSYTIHSAVHSFRPDIKCIIHLHTPAAVAISACKQGLMAISQVSHPVMKTRKQITILQYQFLVDDLQMSTFRIV